MMKLRTSLSAVCAAAAMFGAPAMAAPVFNLFTVDPTVFGTPLPTIAPFTANKITGTYDEWLRLNGDGTFDVAIGWTAGQFTDQQDPPPSTTFGAGRTGLGITHNVYATFRGTGQVVTGPGGGTEFLLDAGGDIDFFADTALDHTGFNFDAVTTRWISTGIATADTLLAFGAAVDGQGFLGPAVSGNTCGAGSGINCGSFGQENEILLTAAGASYFIDPVPFYTVNFVSGQFDDVNLGVPEQFITGSLDAVFLAVPEPGSLMLAGLALAGLGFAGRRRKA